MKRRNFLTGILALLPVTAFSQSPKMEDKKPVAEIVTIACTSKKDELDRHRYSVYHTSTGMVFIGATARDQWIEHFSSLSRRYFSTVHKMDKKLAKLKAKKKKDKLLEQTRVDYLEAGMLAVFCMEDVARLQQKYD